MLLPVLLILFFAFPTLLVCYLYQRGTSPDSASTSRPVRLDFLLNGVSLLSLIFAALAFFNNVGHLGLVALLFLPALDGLLAVLMINGRAVLAFSRENRKLALRALAAYLVSLIIIALGETPSLALLIVVPPLLVALLWNLARRTDLVLMVLLALTLTVFLWTDATGIAASHAVFADTNLRIAYQVLSGTISLLALLLAALFVYRYFKPRQGETPRPLLYLGLAALLVLSVGAATARYGALARATGRAFEDRLPLTILGAALIIGVVLVVSLTGNSRRAGLTFIFVTFLLLGFYILGWQVDPQAVTASRASHLEQAIQEYRQNTGAFPASLDELAPSYVPLVLGPLTGRGQTWCYQSGEGYYRLGYVYFQRYYEYPDGTPFWEPFYDIKIPSASGQPPSGEWICDEELRIFKQHNGL